MGASCQGQLPLTELQLPEDLSLGLAPLSSRHEGRNIHSIMRTHLHAFWIMVGTFSLSTWIAIGINSHGAAWLPLLAVLTIRKSSLGCVYP